MARLVALGESARAEFAGERGGDLFNGREARAGEAHDGETWVGTLGQVVVGYAAARVDVLADGSRLGRITALFVEPEARAVGVGECLVRAVNEWCTAQGCIGIDAAALPGSRATKNFFEESGFTARLLIMHRRLTAPGDRG